MTAASATASPGEIEHNLEGIKRLSHSIWLIGQLLISETGQEFTAVGPAIKQLAEEIEDKITLLGPKVGVPQN